MGLHEASADIAAAYAAHLRSRLKQQELRRPIATIDALIRELEELHVRGQRRVPLSYARRLQELAQLVRPLPLPATAAGATQDLRVKIGIVKLMDALFSLQQGLFVHRAHTLGLQLVPDFS